MTPASCQVHHVGVDLHMHHYAPQNLRAARHTCMQTYKPMEKWKYAYPGVLEGNLTGCTWSSGAQCVDPLEGSDCFKIRCEHIDYDCPPKGQAVCPHFTQVSCGWMPGTTKPYWMHKCNPLAVPNRKKVTFVTCKPQALDGGAFQCYFTQARTPGCGASLWPTVQLSASR
jgi:hypothetical protein